MNFQELIDSFSVFIAKSYDPISDYVKYQFEFEGKRFVKVINRILDSPMSEDLEDSICQEANLHLKFIK